MEYAFVVSQGDNLNLADLPPEFRESKFSVKLPQQQFILSAEEADLIRQALKQSQGKVNLAAEFLGMSRATFWRKRKSYGL